MFDEKKSGQDELPSRKPYNVREAYAKNLQEGGEDVPMFRRRMTPYRWMMLSGAGAGAAWGLRRFLISRRRNRPGRVFKRVA